MTVPIGTILAYGGLVDENARGELARQGWLVCDGEEYSEEDYPELENTIGTIYGNSRPGSFKVPDLRGRFVRGVDAGAGRDPDVESRSGGHEGTKLGSVQEDQLRSHKHQLVSWGRGPQGDIRQNHAFFDTAFTGGDGSVNRSNNTNAMISYGGNETCPKNIYVNWIIKAKNV